MGSTASALGNPNPQKRKGKRESKDNKAEGIPPLETITTGVHWKKQPGEGFRRRLRNEVTEDGL